MSSLTEKIVAVLEKQEKEKEVPVPKMTSLKDLPHVGEDIYLDFAKKSSTENQCFACGDGDRTTVEDMIYAITALSLEGEGEYPTIFFCPRHLTDLAEQLLLHIFRVAKGREEGAIRLPLLKWKGEDE